MDLIYDKKLHPNFLFKNFADLDKTCTSFSNVLIVVNAGVLNSFPTLSLMAFIIGKKGAEVAPSYAIIH